MTDFNLTQFLKHPQYGLLALLAALLGGYLTLVWRIGDLPHFAMSVLFLLAAATLTWENHPKFQYRQEWAGSLTGIGLIGWMLWQSLDLTHEHLPQISLLPFGSALAVALIASGFQGLLQYRRELAIMGFLGIPSLLLNLCDPSLLTAQFATTLLQQHGFNVVRQGARLILPVGTTEVLQDSSGMESMTYLLGIAVICLTLYPIAHFKKIVALLAAVLTGFIVNGARVALLALLAAPSDQPAFLYWYEGEGSLVFSIASIVLFAGFYWALHQIERWQKRARGEDC